MIPEDVRALVGKRVVLKLTPDAGMPGPEVRGRVVGKIESLDGLVAVLEPEETPTVRRSIHYHYIVDAKTLD